MDSFENLIALLDPDVVPERTKLHLATWNGIDEPLDRFRAGTFEAWHASQNNRNFERRSVRTLTATPGGRRWMFGGACERRGRTPKQRLKAAAFVYPPIAAAGEALESDLLSTINGAARAGSGVSCVAFIALVADESSADPMHHQNRLF
mgnify:CR=1 FL=1